MKRKNILIIGGGVAGLSAGILAQLAGYRCTILEKNRQIGGCLSGWDREGYHIDNCLHWLTGTDQNTALYGLWQKLGVLGDDVALHQAKSFFTVERDGKRLSLWQDVERTRADMLLLSPEDRGQIESFFSAVLFLVRRIRKKGKIPPLAELRSPSALLPYLGRTLGDVGRRFHHPLLQMVFLDYMGEEFSAVALLFAYSTFASGNGAIPSGGSCAMAERMGARFRSLGGELLTGLAAQEIRFHGQHVNAVLAEDGSCFGADAIICACDPSVTFGKLLHHKYPPALEKQYRKGLSYTAVQAAFACVWKEPLFESTLVSCARPYFLAGRLRDRLAVREYSYEPSFAPKGKTVLQTLTFLREGEAKNWLEQIRSEEDLQCEKEQIAAKLQEVLLARFPTLGGSLKVLDVWTPLTYYRYLGAWNGAFLSFAMTPGQMFYHLPSRVKPFSNLFLASQWQQSPGGLPTAARCGERAVTALRRYVPLY